MMALTHAPSDLIIGTSDGIDVRFAGVELKDAPAYVGISAGQPGILVYLYGVRGRETMDRDNHLHRERQKWVDRRKDEGAQSAGDAPRMPGVAVFEKLTARVCDDVGTQYQWAGSQAAGDGMDWDACRVYTPAPPLEARRLRLEFSVDGEPTGKWCELALSTPDETDN